MFCDKVNVSRKKSLFHLPWPLGLGNHLMGNVEVLQGVCQKLRAKHLKVGTHPEYLGLRMEMVD
jgi:hypothetical protein